MKLNRNKQEILPGVNNVNNNIYFYDIYGTQEGCLKIKGKGGSQLDYLSHHIIVGVVCVLCCCTMPGGGSGWQLR